MSLSRLSQTSLKAAIALLFCLTVSQALADELRPRLGLSLSSMELDMLLREHLHLAPNEGLLIDNIVSHSALDSYGIKRGDILLGIDRQAFSSPQEIEAYLASKAKSSRVHLDLMQRGERKSFEIELDTLPEELQWKHPRRPELFEPFARATRPAGVPQPEEPYLPPTAACQQRLVFQSNLHSEEGVKQSSVTILGDLQNPQTEIEIRINRRNYQSTVAELNSLPSEPRQVAEAAIRQAQNMPFDFHLGACDPRKNAPRILPQRENAPERLAPTALSALPSSTPSDKTRDAQP